MTEMIERVARALHKAEYPDGSYEGFRAHTPDGTMYERMARAALEAMRELPEEPGPRYSAGEYSRRNHEAMIADALGQAPLHS